MAKTSMIEREKRRLKLVQRYAARRRELKDIIANPATGAEQREAAQQRLQSLPRDSSPSRLRNRCALSGRPKGYYRKFGLGRNKLREQAMQGNVPGLVKASW